MAQNKRSAHVIWTGDSRSGSGVLSSSSGVLKDVPYTHAMRFGDAAGTNPEELIAAAHAACFSMALASRLSRQGYQPESIETDATCVGSTREGGFTITAMRLQTRARVPGIDEAAFREIAHEAESGCPVSRALRGGLEIELDAALE